MLNMLSDRDRAWLEETAIKFHLNLDPIGGRVVNVILALYCVSLAVEVVRSYILAG